MTSTHRMMTIADLLAVAPPSGTENSSAARTIMAHLSRTPWDQDFNEALPITLAATPSVQQLVVSWPEVGKLSMAECAIVDGVAMGVANLSDFDSIKWQVLVDGSAWAGFDSIIGPFGTFIYPKPTMIPLFPGQRVSIVALNIGVPLVAIPLVTAYLMGRRFPLIVADALGPVSLTGG